MGLAFCTGFFIFIMVLILLIKKDGFDVILVFGSLLITVAITMIFVVIPIAAFQKPELVATKINNIVSLKADDRIEGNWTLLCGSINEVDYYFFYEEQANGGFIERKIVKGNTIIFQQDGQPRVEKDIIKVETSFTTIATKSIYEYRLYVPLGTITENFKL